MALFPGAALLRHPALGPVFSLEAGRCVTDDHALPTGWRCLDAVRRGGRLFLYVDGKQAAESAPFDPADYDLGVSDPFRRYPPPHRLRFVGLLPRLDAEPPHLPPRAVREELAAAK
jgi:hypothetical protein